jgi:ABC-type uncharacterized transport system substrate-binding protein
VKALTSEIPIVFAFVNDPIALHFAASLNRPGGNLTSLSNFSVVKRFPICAVSQYGGTQPPLTIENTGGR